MGYIGRRIGKSQTTGIPQADGNGGGVLDIFTSGYFQRSGNMPLSSATLSGPMAASGGNIDGVDGGNGYKYHVFTSPGTFSVSGNIVSSFEVLLIGGGGAGGATDSSNGAGGGGAGGAVHHSQLSITGPLTISVGSEGLHPNTTNTYGGTGGDSTIVSPTGPWTLTAKGGGYGGGYDTAGNPGGSGGGGGGYGGGYGNATAPGTQPAQNAPFVGQPGFNQYGNRGGAPTDSNPGNASGGGGAGGVGNSHPPSSNGGAGQPFPGFAAPIPAFAPLPSAWKTAVGPSGFFAGGGAGENPYGDGNPTASGGAGGGGSGPSANGVTNTGGGGAGMQTGPAAGDGGSGICIIRYIQN
jgi:hypothetical protein